MGVLIQSQLQALYRPWTMHSLPSQNTCAPTQHHKHIDVLVSWMQYIHLTYLELMSQKIFTVRQLAIHLEELTFLVTKLLRKKKPKCQSWSMAKHIGIQCQAVLTLRSILFAFAGCIGVE